MGRQPQHAEPAGHPGPALLGAVSASQDHEKSVSCPNVTGTPITFFYWEEECEENCQHDMACINLECTCDSYCAQEHLTEDQEVCSINCNNPESKYTASRAKHPSPGCLGRLILTEKKPEKPNHPKKYCLEDWRIHNETCYALCMKHPKHGNTEEDKKLCHMECTMVKKGYTPDTVFSCDGGGEVVPPPHTEGCVDSHHPGNILDGIKSANDLGKLAELIEKVPGIKMEITKMGKSFTFFAPTDSALNKIPMREYKELLKDPESIRHILMHHIVPGCLSQSTIDTRHQEVTTVGGEMIKVTWKQGSANTPKMVHYPYGESHANVSCPAMNGEYYYCAKITSTGGVIKIDNLLKIEPPTTEGPTEPPIIGNMDCIDRQSNKNLYQEIEENGKFTILKQLLHKVPGIIEEISTSYQEPHKFTFFAPNDDAFLKLDSTELAELKKDPESIRHILMHHIVDQCILSKQNTASNFERKDLRTVGDEMIRVDDNMVHYPYGLSKAEILCSTASRSSNKPCAIKTKTGGILEIDTLLKIEPKIEEPKSMWG